MAFDAVREFLQRKFQIKSTEEPSDKFALGMANAMHMRGEFNATAQIDSVPGGPTSIQGATLYAGALGEDSPMLVQGSVGPPMSDPLMEFELPFAIGASSEVVNIGNDATVVIVVAISWGTDPNNLNMSYLWQKVTLH